MRLRVFCLLSLALISTTMVACDSVKPAGSLGYMLNGDPLAPPIPTDYRRMPPPDEGRGPMRWQAKF